MRERSAGKWEELWSPDVEGRDSLGKCFPHHVF